MKLCPRIADEIGVMENSKISRRCQAFTLVELLVVIAITAVLASLLLPVLIRTKQAALSVKCQSNLRQLGVGLAMYVGDFQRYPAGLQIDSGFLALVPYVAKYRGHFMDQRGLLNCPNKPLPDPNIQIAPEDAFYTDYLYNWHGTAHSRTASLGLSGELAFINFRGNWLEGYAGIKESWIKAPSDMAALGDLYAEAGLIVASNRDPRNLANELYCDGHVENARRSRLLVASTENLRRWNYDNEPH